MKAIRSRYEVSIYGHPFLIYATSAGNAVRRCFRRMCPKRKRKSYLGPPLHNDPAPLVSDNDGGWEGVSVKVG